MGVFASHFSLVEAKKNPGKQKREPKTHKDDLSTEDYDAATFPEHPIKLLCNGEPLIPNPKEAAFQESRLRQVREVYTTLDPKDRQKPFAVGGDRVMVCMDIGCVLRVLNDGEENVMCYVDVSFFSSPSLPPSPFLSQRQKFKPDEWLTPGRPAEDDGHVLLCYGPRVRDRSRVQVTTLGDGTLVCNPTIDQSFLGARFKILVEPRQNLEDSTKCYIQSLAYCCSERRWFIVPAKLVTGDEPDKFIVEGVSRENLIVSSDGRNAIPKDEHLAFNLQTENGRYSFQSATGQYLAFGEDGKQPEDLVDNGNFEEYKRLALFSLFPVLPE
eukprot:m.219502 g.219502  ORF g.219502 m.219502 type:complete len:327 (+) comp39924_c0_seq12:700-1680(+)